MNAIPNLTAELMVQQALRTQRPLCEALADHAARYPATDHRAVHAAKLLAVTTAEIPRELVSRAAYALERSAAECIAVAGLLRGLAKGDVA